MQITFEVIAPTLDNSMVSHIQTYEGTLKEINDKVEHLSATPNVYYEPIKIMYKGITVDCNYMNIVDTLQLLDIFPDMRT